MNPESPTVAAHPLLNGNNPLSPLYHNLINCKICERIVAFRTGVAKTKRRQFADWGYWGRPVPGYGDWNGRLLLVGLAPAAHGGNRTGRVFTGDKSADFLVRCLYDTGLANQPDSLYLTDGLELHDTFMTPVLKCVPPQDKPKGEELRNCFHFFNCELEILKRVEVILALGKVAFDGCLKFWRQQFDLKVKDHPFGHDRRYVLPNGKILWGCFHPSPRNVNTGRLTYKMMIDLLRHVKSTMRIA